MAKRDGGPPEAIIRAAGGIDCYLCLRRLAILTSRPGDMPAHGAMAIAGRIKYWREAWRNWRSVARSRALLLNDAARRYRRGESFLANLNARARGA